MFVGFHGNQHSSVPGPAQLPVNSNDVPVARDIAPTLSLDDKARTILVTMARKADATNSVFFSQSNIDALQASLQERVLKELRARIQPQSEADLIIIMRSVYLRTAPNNRAIATMNRETLEEAFQLVRNNVHMYHAYVNAPAQRVTNPLEYAVSTSIRGEAMDGIVQNGVC